MNSGLAFPENLIWWWIIPLGIGLIILIYIRSRKTVKSWFSRGEYIMATPWLKLILRVVGFIFLFVALIGPFWGRVEREVTVQSRDVFILLDVSASMNAEDIRPSRLDKIKSDLRKMINDLKGDRMGLIVFTRYAYVQCPLTQDHKTVELFLDLVETNQFSNTGTNFRAALTSALDRFVNTEQQSANASRSIVLISDGEDFGDNYGSVINRLKKEQVKVFPVGIGTYRGSKVPNLVNGEKKGYKSQQDGSPAISVLKDDHLSELAETFGTQYHKIDDGIDNLDPVVDQIKLQASASVDTKQAKLEYNWYWFFLILALIPLIFSLFWMPIKQKRNSLS